MTAKTKQTLAKRHRCTKAKDCSLVEERVPVEDGQEYIKKCVLKDLDLIAGALVEKARAGGTAQLRLLWTLGKLDEDAKAVVTQTAPSLSALLMQEIRTKEAAKKRGSK